MSVFKAIYSVSNFIREYHAGLFRGVLTFVDNTFVYLDKSESLRDHKLMDIWRGDKGESLLKTSKVAVLVRLLKVYQCLHLCWSIR